jgi:DNA-binding NarL/FixJ family response regulator
MKKRIAPSPRRPANQKKTRIAIVEDELLLANMLEDLLSRFRDLTVVGCAADGEAGWQLCQTTQPDLALVDIELP